MADTQEVAALKAQVLALQNAQAPSSGGKKSQHYVVHAEVFSDCHMPIEEPPPPTEPEGGASVDARLNRIEEQLQRVIAMLEKREA